MAEIPCIHFAINCKSRQWIAYGRMLTLSPKFNSEEVGLYSHLISQKCRRPQPDCHLTPPPCEEPQRISAYGA